jgi:3-hydroxyacyl-[acyl-carrier-protein] dehydratase
VLTLTLKPKRVKEPLAVYTGSIRVGQEKAISAEEITLTFGIVDAPPAPEPVPSPAAEPISAPAPVAATAAPSVPSTAVPTPAA